MLAEAGLPAHVALGSKTDFVFVRRAQGAQACDVLRRRAFPGLIAHHPDFERQPSPQDALAPLSPEDPDFEKAMALCRKFPPPEWGPGVIDKIARMTTARPIITPDLREFVENYEL